MSKAQIVLQIVMLLQGTSVEDFARAQSLRRGRQGRRALRRERECRAARGPSLQARHRNGARRYSHRFTTAQLLVLADLYVTALEHLEPAAVPRVRSHMCDATSEAARRDAAAAIAVCERLSMDY